MTFKMFMTLTCHRKQTNEQYAKKKKINCHKLEFIFKFYINWKFIVFRNNEI